MLYREFGTLRSEQEMLNTSRLGVAFLNVTTSRKGRLHALCVRFETKPVEVACREAGNKFGWYREALSPQLTRKKSEGERAFFILFTGRNGCRWGFRLNFTIIFTMERFKRRRKYEC